MIRTLWEWLGNPIFGATPTLSIAMLGILIITYSG